MTEQEALDLAAQAAKWSNWDYARQLAECGEIEAIRAHAKTIMELAKLTASSKDAAAAMQVALASLEKRADYIAALKAENEALKALRDDDGELLTIAWMDGAHRSNKAHRGQVAALKAENERLREALGEIADVGDDVDCPDCKASGVAARAAMDFTALERIDRD